MDNDHNHVHDVHVDDVNDVHVHTNMKHYNNVDHKINNNIGIYDSNNNSNNNNNRA